MAAVGQIQIQGQIQGAGYPAAGLTFPPYYIGLPSAVPEILTLTLTGGFNSLAIPTGASVALFVPPNYSWPTPLTGFQGLLTFKGVTGDTGTVISNTAPFLLSLTTTSAFGIANGTINTATTATYTAGTVTITGLSAGQGLQYPVGSSIVITGGTYSGCRWPELRRSSRHRLPRPSRSFLLSTPAPSAAR
jgi:hypothetical protein